MQQDTVLDLAAGSVRFRAARFRMLFS